MSMYGKGMSPRKAMAMGGAGESLGTPSAYPGSNGRPHPDMAARTGEQGMGNHLKDAERAVGMPIMHAKGHLPAQAAPRHGPHHEAELGFKRDGMA